MATVAYSHKSTGAAYTNHALVQALLASGKKFGEFKEQSQIPLVAPSAGYQYGGSLDRKQSFSIEAEYNKPFSKIKNAKARKPRTFSHETIRRMH